MEVIELVEEMHNICDQLRRDGRRIRFVPTMGALHSGHASLIERARKDGVAQWASCCDEDVTAANEFNRGGGERQREEPQSEERMLNLEEAAAPQGLVVVIVSIFVNPKQFNNLGDYIGYPKTLDADLELCRKLKVNYVFKPSGSGMYPDPDAAGLCTILAPKKLAKDLEGKSRPGHFDGMLTVVCKLFNIIKPHEAYFGEKDYQQLVLVSKMVDDLNFSVRIRPVATVRDHDLLPLSSRNVKLSESLRQVAPVMYTILSDAKQALELGFTTLALVNDNNNMCCDINSTILASMLTTLCVNLDDEASRLVRVDYLELRCHKDLSEIHYAKELNAFDCRDECVRRQAELGDGEITLRARLLIAVILGSVRLLDNIEVRLNLSGSSDND